jgi:hypothetical protein
MRKWGGMMSGPQLLCSVRLVWYSPTKGTQAEEPYLNGYVCEKIQPLFPLEKNPVIGMISGIVKEH